MGVVVWILVVIGGLVALLLVLLALVLLVPVRFDAVWTEARRDFVAAGPGLRFGYDALDGTMEVRVLGRFRRRWAAQRRTATGTEEGRRPRRRRKRGARAKLSPRRLWAQRRRVVRAVATFLRRLRWRRLHIDAILATPDPALTGWLCAAAYSGRAALPERWRHGVGVRPDFVREVPDLAAEASLRLQPLQAALLALRLYLVVRSARRRQPRRTRASTNATTRPRGGGRNEGS